MKNLKNKKAFSLIELSIVILIIGIIIAGVTQSSRLIGAFKLSTARSVTQSSPVHSIKDLVLWLEPVMENSITSLTNANAPENGDRITSWNDVNSQATSKINLTQGTAGNRPYYVSAGINNLPTLSFVGGQFMDNTSVVPIPAGNKEYTIFAVWQASSMSGVGLLVHQRGATNCTGGDRAGMYIASPNTVNTWGCGGGADTVTSSSAVINRPYLSIYRVDNTASSSSNNIKSYLNGTQSATVSATLTNLGGSAFVIGFGDTTNTYYYSGYISEIIVFSRALKAAEIVDVRTYIAKKYGFSA